MDLVGKRFGKFTVIERAPNLDTDSHARWLCRCDCGREEVIPGRSLTQGRRTGCKQCVCIRPNFNDLTGKRFGRLTVIERVERGAEDCAYWKCLCDCGNETIVSSHSLNRTKRGVRSCGCLGIDTKKALFTKHAANTQHASDEERKLYKVWCSMRSRCNCKTSQAYKDYGARGISVCEEWDTIDGGFEKFRDWSFSNGYRIGLTIERVNVNGNYEPENCIWADRKVQANNTRRTIHITCNNETHTINEWADITGLKRETIVSRIMHYNWPVEDALHMKVWEGHHGKKKEA